MNIFLFDIDGTLLSSGGAGKAALELGFQEEFGVPCAMEKVTLSGRTDRAITSDVLRHSNVEDTASNRARLLQAYLRHLPRCMVTGAGRVLPGVVELLDHLCGRQQVAVGLLTGNIRAGAHIKLAHFGLSERFAFGGYGDEHACRNDVAHQALADVHRHLGRTVDPSRIWVIGDTPLDVQCARAIGARVVAVTTGYHPREELAGYAPDFLLDDLRTAHLLLDHLALQ